MATLIRVDGSETTVSPTGRKFTLHEMYRLIGCDIVERVRVPGKPYRWLWCDENGLANRKAFNRAATELLRMKKFGVVGDVLVTGTGEV